MIKLKITNAVHGKPCVRFNKSTVYSGEEYLNIFDIDGRHVDSVQIENFIEVPIQLGYTYIESMSSGNGSKLELTAVNFDTYNGVVEFDSMLKPVTSRLRLAS